jgi:RNA polymerase sigma-70 factor (ECF subfamily)
MAAPNHLWNVAARAESIGVSMAVAALLDRVRARDQKALSALVEAFDHDLMRVAFLVGGDRQTAEDATQITWERFWKNPPTLRAPDQLKSWLLSVAANEARQAGRRHRRGIELSRPVSTETIAPPTDDDARLDLANALARLTAPQREILGLRFVLEQSSSTIAAHLGITPEGARSRVHRALNQLRSEMGDG